MDRLTARTAESGRAFVNELFQTVIGAGEGSLKALEELSGIAMGGHEQARELIAQIDEAVAAGDLRLPWGETQKGRFMGGEKTSRLADVLFIATHPVLSLRAASRQVAVGIEHQAPPAGSTFGDFVELSLADAARVMQAAEQKESSGVPSNAWSKADQERMAKGEMPQGHPEHPNV